MAATGVAAGAAAANVIADLYAAHTARLKDATNENQAADILIPAFDADLAAVAANFNSGAWTAAQAIAVLQEIDSNSYAYLYKQVGKAGTAWSVPPNQGASGGVQCNKSCTVGCCLYYSDLRPAIYGADEFASGTVGFIPVLKGSGGQPSTGHKNQVYVPEVYPPSDTAYGNYQRAAYWIPLTIPQPKSKAAVAIAAVPSLPASNPVPVPTTIATASEGSATVATATAEPATTSLSSLFTNSELVTIVAVIGGIIVIITALFGGNALRVDK
jgi:hypothetical protein